LAKNKSPQTFQKRQRERDKQRKRLEKQDRRIARNREKRRFNEARENATFYLFQRAEEEMHVDTVIWLCVLDLAALQGWVPTAELEPEDPDQPTYVSPVGMTISANDAHNIGQSIEAELPRISEAHLAYQDHPFGEDHTQDLLFRRLDNQIVQERDILAAREILSGRPRRSAAVLSEFLMGGAFRVVSEE
jgi:hypothetical protein